MATEFLYIVSFMMPFFACTFATSAVVLAMFFKTKDKKIKEKKDKDGNIIVYESDVADRMAKIITVPISSSNAGERIIPQGYPTSPIVSFLSYKEMFDKINDVAIKYNCKFSTYVDDISFSYKDNNFNPNDLITEVSNILNDYGHSISEKKIKIIDIEKELGIEIVGDTKVKIAIEEDEEPWDDIPEEVTEETEKEIEENIDPNYIKEEK